MIELEKISRNLAGKAVLREVSMTVERGETQVIIGASGAGKSVILRHIMGLLSPDSGRIVLDKQPLGEEGKALEAVRSRCGVLFQSGALINWMTVFENVSLPLYEKTDLSDKEINTKVREKLKLVGMQDTGSKMPAELSGGMRKRVGLARAIVRDPSIMLYDEPTSGLDPVLARSIDKLIYRLQRQMNVTSIVVTHDLHSAFYIGDRIALLSDGRIAVNCAPTAFAVHKLPAVRDFIEAQFGDCKTASQFAKRTAIQRDHENES